MTIDPLVFGIGFWHSREAGLPIINMYGGGNGDGTEAVLTAIFAEGDLLSSDNSALWIGYFDMDELTGVGGEGEGEEATPYSITSQYNGSGVSRDIEIYNKDFPRQLVVRADGGVEVLGGVIRDAVYTATVTAAELPAAVLEVVEGDVVMDVYAQVTEAFAGVGEGEGEGEGAVDSVVLGLGDSEDAAGFLEIADIASTGWVGGNPPVVYGWYLFDGGDNFRKQKVYDGSETLTLSALSGSPTEGSITLYIVLRRLGGI
jgi:hypothetical protein